jgi:N-acyl-D-amino-acid deacylase
VLRDLGRGVIEIALTQSPGVLSDEEYATLDFLLTESRSKVTWLALLNRDDIPEACLDSLRRADPLIRRGGVPQVTCLPLTVQIDLKNPFIFADTTTWKPAFNKTVAEQKAIYGSKQFRADARDELCKQRLFSGRWDRVVIKEAPAALADLEGKTVGQVAAERGKDGLDTFLDLGIEADLDIQFSCALFNADERRIPELINDPRTMIGLSDGGAHVDMLCDAGYATHFLARWVREQPVMTLERAVERLTAEPARFFGIRDRGTRAKGMAADLVVFDLDTVGCAGRPEMRNDLPGGGRRLVVESRGVQFTIVNGEIVHGHRTRSDAFPGRILRAGSNDG